MGSATVPMLYRSPLTRWVLTIGGVWAGLAIALGPDRWRSTTSLHWLAKAGIPLQVWGWALVVYALMLLWRRTRPAGFAFGGALYAVFAVSLLATIAIPGPKSAVAIVGLFDLAAFHGYAVRTALAANYAEEGRS